LANLAKRLAIGNRVQIMDPRFGQAKWALIESCYGFVHTSRWEGLPFSVLEALAVGRPVIVTPETNLAHLVGQYRSGFVVDATPESIAEGIDALLRASPNEYRSMQERARALARENFVWKNSAHAIAQLYRSLTERRRSSGGSRQFLPLP
jgi:glycosyltransferase involved in cell wall biosynthesis